MRRGLFGGTFNPVHFGHLCLADEARHFADLDVVTFIPNNRPPHKDMPQVTGELRYDLLLAAVKAVPYFSVSRVELERSGPSYTKDTLDTFPPEEELIFVCGADAFEAEWHKLDDVLNRLSRVIIAHRAGYPIEIPARLRVLEPELLSKVTLMPFPEINISSSELRARIAEEKPFRFLIPEPVYRIITKSGLYSVQYRPTTRME